jgi:hypothetical protein
VSDHPVRSIEVASLHFLEVATTPPHEEGNNLAQKFVKKTRNYRFVVQRAQRKAHQESLFAAFLCALCVFVVPGIRTVFAKPVLRSSYSGNPQISS